MPGYHPSLLATLAGGRRGGGTFMGKGEFPCPRTIEGFLSTFVPNKADCHSAGRMTPLPLPLASPQPRGEAVS